MGTVVPFTGASRLVLSSQQQQALDLIGAWFQGDPAEAIEYGFGVDTFTLAGYAGTGKTTIAKLLPELLGTDVTYAAFTGKAASVLRSKGMPATTLHSILFRPRENEDKIKQLEDELRSATGTRRVMVEEALLELSDNVDFMPVEVGEAPGLLVVDEYSMVDEWLFDKIAAKFTKVLFLGDPFQLPPVKGNPCPLRPNFTLTQVHRHAGPLLEAVNMIRDRRIFEGFNNGVFRWVSNKSPEAADLADQDVILCHTNATRKAINTRQRKRRGHEGRPRLGEPLVILRNSYANNVWNGEVHRLNQEAQLLDRVTLGLRFVGFDQTMEAERACFQPGCLMPRDMAKETRDTRRGFETSSKPLICDYGYALTVHKSQGSEWPKVGLLHDYRGAPDTTYWRWLYTCASRAREEVLIVG